MEVIPSGVYWTIKNERGPVPRELQGEWVSKHIAVNALEMFQKKVQSRAINTAEKRRERIKRASNKTTIDAGSDELGEGADNGSLSAQFS